MKSICFFCHFHNGDIYHIKEFLIDISSQLKTKYYIAHENSSLLTHDIDIEHINISKIPLLVGKHYTKFIETEDCLYVNAWIGGYFSSDNEYNMECSLRGFHRMFSHIYATVGEKFKVDLKLGNVEEYFPSIDYSKFDCNSIDKFISKNTNNKILISNGPALSCQTTYNTDMSEIIEPLAKEYPNNIFILTKKFNTSISNIKFTEDIINSKTCDLNEISYISRFCKLIIGRNSGPFCFTVTKENINDEDKKFLAFGDKPTDCFPYMLDIKSEFMFDYFSGIDNLKKTITELLN
jgi:hypothetical protein